MTQHAHLDPSALFLEGGCTGEGGRTGVLPNPRLHRLAEEMRRIGQQDKQLITLHQSGHCIMVDRQWECVAERTYDFVVGRGG